MTGKVDVTKWEAEDDHWGPAFYIADDDGDFCHFEDPDIRDLVLHRVQTWEAMREALEKIARQEPIRYFGDSPVYHGSVDIARAALQSANEDATP